MLLQNMAGPQGHHAKQGKSDRERQRLCDLTYMWNLKTNKLVDRIDLVVARNRRWQGG